MSTGTHRHRCRKETRKRKKHAYHSCSFPKVNCMRMCNVSHTSLKSLFQCPHPASDWPVICLFCFLPPPHYLKHALQSVPRLYTGNGQVKTPNPHSTSCSISHSDICCFHSCMTLWDSPSKNRMFDTFTSFPHRCDESP